MTPLKENIKSFLREWEATLLSKYQIGTLINLDEQYRNSVSFFSAPSVEGEEDDPDWIIPGPGPFMLLAANTQRVREGIVYPLASLLNARGEKVYWSSDCNGSVSLSELNFTRLRYEKVMIALHTFETEWKVVNRPSE